MEQPLSPNEIQVYDRRLRSLLETLHVETEDELDTLSTFADQRGDSGDEAAEEAALDPELTVQEVADEQQVLVERALERIAAGTYGRCVTCGRPIERERLDVVPEASECAEDARASADRGRVENQSA
jgi:DnaK suppressor protein